MSERSLDPTKRFIPGQYYHFYGEPYARVISPRAQGSVGPSQLSQAIAQDSAPTAAGMGCGHAATASTSHSADGSHCAASAVQVEGRAENEVSTGPPSEREAALDTTPHSRGSAGVPQRMCSIEHDMQQRLVAPRPSERAVEYAIPLSDSESETESELEEEDEEDSGYMFAYFYRVSLGGADFEHVLPGSKCMGILQQGSAAAGVTGQGSCGQYQSGSLQSSKSLPGASGSL